MSRWPDVKLGDVCVINPRPSVQGALTEDSEVTFIPMSAIDEDRARIAAPERRRLADVAKGYTSFCENDVLFAKITPCMENGKAAIARDLVNGLGFGSTEFHVLRPTAVVKPEWVLAMIRRAEFRSEAARSFTGTAGQKRVPVNFLSNYEIPLPPLPEQERIVRILDQADELRRLRREADRRTADLIPALFHDMFGDPATNPKGFAVSPLTDLLTRLKNGINVRQSDDGKGVPVTRIETISDGVVDPNRVKWTSPDSAVLEGYSLQGGDILFSHINSPDHIGKTAIYEGAPSVLLHGINLLLLRPDKTRVHPIWLSSLLKLDQSRLFFRRRCKRAVNQASVNRSDLAAFNVAVPSLFEQKAFADRVGRIRDLESKQFASRGRLDDLFQSLLHRAFEGLL